MPIAVAYWEITVTLRLRASSSAWSLSGTSHQSISPRRSAAIAEKGSNVSHSTRSKCATLGPAVNPRATCARLIEREALVGSTGAANVLIGQKAIGAAADDFGDRL